MKVYEVIADRKTGEWLGSPEFSGVISSFEWNQKKDTEEIHFDTYEYDDMTRVIVIKWVD